MWTFVPVMSCSRFVYMCVRARARARARVWLLLACALQAHAAVAMTAAQQCLRPAEGEWDAPSSSLHPDSDTQKPIPTNSLNTWHRQKHCPHMGLFVCLFGVCVWWMAEALLPAISFNFIIWSHAESLLSGLACMQDELSIQPSGEETAEQRSYFERLGLRYAVCCRLHQRDGKQVSIFTHILYPEVWQQHWPVIRWLVDINFNFNMSSLGQNNQSQSASKLDQVIAHIILM